MKSYTKVVFVDVSEKSILPREIIDVLYSGDNSVPLLAFMSPNGQTNFGSFSHKTLKSQDYNKIFRDVKKKIREAKKEGTLNDSGLVAKSNDSADEDNDDNVDTASEAVVMVSPRLRTWKSAKGKTIKAKFIKFEDNLFHFETIKGKIIAVKATDLDAASVTTAEEIININKK